MSSIVPVIMCGGNGTRMWPLSRTNYPKQFLNLTSEDKSLLQQTIERIPTKADGAIFVCNENHRFLLAEQVLNIGYQANTILLEPSAKNTAPAIALAAFKALESNKDAILLVLASDHAIAKTAEFHHAIDQAHELAEKGKLVTFGISPSKPETGYGYIKQGQAIANSAGFDVAEFVEKPDLETAQAYLESGQFSWNSGMFMFKAQVYLDELKKYSPEIYQVCEKSIQEQSTDLDFTRINAEAFASCPDDSIDYAVMEKTDKAAVVPMDIGWNDVGSWASLWEISDKDDNNNVIVGDVINQDSSGNHIHSPNKLTATIGIKDLVIIDTPDAILVADKNQSQAIKKVVATLDKQERSEHITHREVYRPWGKYDSIDNGKRFQVKRITVKPGEKLSVQMHHHRAEHWIVVSGTARVRNGDKEFLMTENESTYIPIGEIHYLENPGKVPLELIEVQSGSYLGEDDIVRFEDRYGRVESK